MDDRELRRGGRFLTLFTFLPLIVFAALYASGYVPAKWRNLYFLATLGGVLLTIVVVPVRERFRQERMEGLKPPKRGFSNKLALVAQELRAYADSLDEGYEPGLSPTLRSYIHELRKLAHKQDKRKILAKIDEENPTRIREAAGELELYAQEVRARGGIFQHSWYEQLAGTAVLLAGLWWGCRLVWRYWDRPSWSFFGGVFLIVSCGGLLYAAVRMFRDPP